MRTVVSCACGRAQQPPVKPPPHIVRGSSPSELDERRAPSCLCRSQGGAHCVMVLSDRSAKSISNLYAQEFTSCASTQAADRGEPKCGMRSCWPSPSSRSPSPMRQASTGCEAEFVEDRSDAASSGSPAAVSERPPNDVIEIAGSHTAQWSVLAGIDFLSRPASC